MDWGALARVGAGALAGYTGAPQQQRDPNEQGLLTGPLMQYLQRKKNKKLQTTSGGTAHRNPMGIPGADLGQPPPQDPWANPEPYPGLGGLAQGKLVTEPTTAMIGENGPEMVVPLGYRPDAKVGPRNALPRMNYMR